MHAKKKKWRGRGGEGGGRKKRVSLSASYGDTSDFAIDNAPSDNTASRRALIRRRRRRRGEGGREGEIGCKNHAQGISLSLSALILSAGASGAGDFAQLCTSRRMVDRRKVDRRKIDLSDFCSVDSSRRRCPPCGAFNLLNSRRQGDSSEVTRTRRRVAFLSTFLLLFACCSACKRM
jgi:hypothetical protein